MSAPAQFNLLGCSLDCRTLIEASAGTGKTWNISGLYLRLLLEKKLTVDRILVVTFTKAATAELRERIRSRIVEMLDALRQEGPITDKFLASLAARLIDELQHQREQLVQALDLALQSFDEAAICTIHSFCQRALAESPFAAGMPFATEITQDDRLELAEAVNDFWRRRIARNIHPQLAHWLHHCKDTPEKYQSLLRRMMGKPVARIEWPDEEPADVDAIQQRIAELFAEVRPVWQAARDDFHALLSDAGLKETHNAARLAEAFAACDDYFAGDGSGRCGEKGALLCAARIAAAVRRGGIPPEHPLLAMLQELLADLPDLADHALTLQRLQLLRAMLEECGARLVQSKRDKRLVSYDDLLVNLHRALSDGSAPWLAASLRQRFPVALIDEFQDTDPLQFDIFSRIYADATEPLFLVGDPKQAIYSFRNADLHTYLGAKQSVAATATLGNNQRSSKGLIDALNALFGANPRAFLLEGLDYHAVGFGEKPRLAFTDPTSPAEDLQVWMLPGDGLLERSAALDLATQATASEIARLVNEGAAGTIRIDGRGLQPGDIAVLVRSHREAARIRDALQLKGVASIEISQESVFASSDAADLEILLGAILEPARQGRVLAALSTALMGCTAAQIDVIAASEAALSGHVERFTGYRDTWFSYGLGSMLRQLLEKEGVSARLLARPDGERRMTNLRHLGEALQQLPAQCAAPESALRWLQAQRRASGPDESAQLRLESDRELVQILTIHKSKGLEYPLVFCPYLWDGFRRSGSEPDGLEYHDDSGQALIDFRIDEAVREAGRQAIAQEADAETLRLHYVALTRASHRCHIVAGPYGKKTRGASLSTKEAGRAMLNWFVNSRGIEPHDWRKKPLEPQVLRTLWQEWGASAPGTVMRELLQLDTDCTSALPQRAALLAARDAQRFLKEDWRIGSFSGLVRGLGEASVADHDEHAVDDSDARADTVPDGLAAHDALLFPRGSEAGQCMHCAFENADFTDQSSWGRAVDQALAQFPQPVESVPLSQQRSMLEWMLADVLNTPLQAGLALSAVPRHKRLNELEFSFPAQGLAAGELNALLQEHGYRMGALAFHRLDGFLKGFIDLVFEHDGKFYLLDWKSNHLGYRPEDYARKRLEEAMAQHGYVLQYLVYSLALHRYLATRLPNYSYEQHFGGVHYLFVRGVRPHWTAGRQQCGVYSDRPTLAFLQKLDALLGGQDRREAA